MNWSGQGSLTCGVSKRIVEVLCLLSRLLTKTDQRTGNRKSLAAHLRDCCAATGSFMKCKEFQCVWRTVRWKVGGVWCEPGGRLGPALPCRDTLRIFTYIRAAASQDSRQRRDTAS